jgi:hypothetical protein
MSPDQIEIETDLLDVRRREYLMLLGFQDWGVVPSQLQNRRANFLLRVPSRGIVEGYSRSKIDTKAEDTADTDWWPEPDLRDTFDALDGTELWAEFERIDEEKKMARMGVDPDEADGDDELTPHEAVAEIKAAGNAADYVQENEFNGQTYFDADLIQFDYPELSNRQAEQTKKALAREYDPQALLRDAGGEAHPQGAP